MSTHEASADKPIDSATGAIDLRHFERRSYSGDHLEQAAFEHVVRLCKDVASQLRARGPGHVAEIAGHACWVSPLFSADEPLISAMNTDLDTTEFTYALFPSHIEDLSAEELDAIAEAIQHWLANPQFLTMDQARLDEAVAVIIQTWTNDDHRFRV